MNDGSNHSPFTDHRSRVSIIIVNWNGLEHLETCLDSLRAQTFTDFEVVIVDNGSTDGSVDLLQSRYAWVKLVKLGQNTGFATGNNIGLQHACGEYIVTLNNDTEADPGWLAVIVKVADGNPQVGMVGSRICSFDNPEIIDSVGHAVCRDGMSRGRYRLRRWPEIAMGEVEEILFPSACVALYRRTMLDEIGFFDDEFFAYAEDTDLGLRGRLAGWKALVATNAVVRHKYSKTGGVFSPFKLYLVERNHYWVAIKTFPLPMLLLVPFFSIIRYLVQIKIVLSSQGSGLQFRDSGSSFAIMKAIFCGSWHGLCGTCRMLRKRRRIMTLRKISSSELSLLLKKFRLGFHELLDANPV